MARSMHVSTPLADKPTVGSIQSANELHALAPIDVPYAIEPVIMGRGAKDE